MGCSVTYFLLGRMGEWVVRLIILGGRGNVVLSYFFSLSSEGPVGGSVTSLSSEGAVGCSVTSFLLAGKGQWVARLLILARKGQWAALLLLFFFL